MTQRISGVYVCDTIALRTFINNRMHMSLSQCSLMIRPKYRFKNLCDSQFSVSRYRLTRKDHLLTHFNFKRKNKVNNNEIVSWSYHQLSCHCPLCRI